MSLKKARAPRNVSRPITTSSGNASLPQALCAAIEDQCACLLNVLGAVHCMSIGIVTQAERPVPEFCAAFDLLEREIHRVIGDLKGISLRDEMRGLL
jgi:hypothetical protein